MVKGISMQNTVKMKHSLESPETRHASSRGWICPLVKKGNNDGVLMICSRFFFLLVAFSHA